MENISPLNVQSKADLGITITNIVLFALVYADHRCMYVDVGYHGRFSDGGVFANSSIFKAFGEKSLHIPFGKPLPRREDFLPYFIVCDEAFSSKDLS